jgi:hypothetical protein
MNNRYRILVFFTLLLLLSGVCGAVAPDPAITPYTSIVDRNLFGLKDPPPPIPVVEDKKKDQPKLLLTGIATLSNKTRALLKTASPVAAKPGEPAKENSWMIEEGQAMDGIEVISIDTKNLVVKVRQDGGEPFELNFKDNGVKLAGGGPGAPLTPVPSPFASPTPTPGAIPPPPNPFAAPNASGFKSIPTRNLRIPGDNSQAGASGNPNLFNGAAENNATSYNAASFSTAPSASQRSIEENVAIAEASRLRNEQLRSSGAQRPSIPQHPYLRNLAPAPQ